ncbi:hypothetical protein CRUP_002571 [Coryphaenoides rupestris]|nr:hypothetical protein CRUP_002571 [Coryphaenoides rupestris]
MTTSPEQQKLLVLQNYIGGKFVACRDHIDSYDPSTGRVYCRVPDSSKDESNGLRSSNKLADLIEANLDEFALAESKDQGKTLAFARTVDIPRAAYNFRFFASSVLHHTNDSSQMDHMGCLHYTIRCPVGVGEA